MGCCYSTPIIECTDLDKGPDLEPLVAWRFPDPCKPGAGGVSARPPPSQQGVSVSGTPATPQPNSATPPGATAGDGAAANQTGSQQQRGTSGGTSSSSRPARPPLVPLANMAATPSRHPHVSPELVRLQYRELTPEDYELLCLLDETLPKRGTASVNLVSRLPCLLACDCDATECQICLGELQNHTRVSRLPCNHVFHPECIQKWLTQCNGTCPLCLSSIKYALDMEPDLKVADVTTIASALANNVHALSRSSLMVREEQAESAGDVASKAKCKPSLVESGE